MNIPRPSIIIVGAGQTGRDLANKLVPDWDVVVVDVEETKLKLLPESKHITRVKGDATSRLVLKKLELTTASYFIIATGRDDVNLEVARLALERGTRRIIAVSIDVKRNDEYLKLGVEVVNRAHAVVGILFSKIEKGKVVASGIGLGKGEIIEVTVLPGSVVVGKRLSELRPKAWLVGAVYRRDEFIVPHGDTKIQVGDRILLIGNPDIIKVIAELLRTGSPEFPLQYGARLLTYMPSYAPEVSKEELEYLLKNTRAYEARIAGSNTRACWKLESDLKNAGLKISYDPQIKFQENPQDVLDKEDVGLVIMPPFSLSILEIIGLKKGWASRIFDRVNIPVLIARGTHPYEKITLFATSRETLRREAELAIDLARLLGSQLTIATVVPPEFSVDREVKVESEHILSEALQIALMYGIKIQEVCLEGNPIEEMEQFSETQNLIIIGHKRGVWNHVFKPDVSLHVASRSHCSCIIVPHEG